jgi:hypothetical protein
MFPTVEAANSDHFGTDLSFNVNHMMTKTGCLYLLRNSKKEYEI